METSPREASIYIYYIMCSSRCAPSETTHYELRTTNRAPRLTASPT